VGYGDKEVFLADADMVGEPLYLAEDADGGRLAGTPHHLDAVPLDQAAPQSLRHRLLGGPAAGVVALGEAELLAVGDLLFGKEALAYPGGTLEGELHPVDVDYVDPDPWYHETVHGPYGTADAPSAKGLIVCGMGGEAVIIGNPNSGRAGSKGYLERYADTLRSGGLSVEVLNTERPDHATELASSAGDRLVVAAGGDGTINEVINGLDQDATLGILPLGTANVLAREIALPLDVEQACERILRGERTRIDLGVARSEDGVERRFACMAGIGFDAHVVGAVTPRLKRYLRGLAFAVMAFKVLFQKEFPPVQIVHGDKTCLTRFAIIANSHYYGGDFQVTRPGLLTNGELEAVLIERVSALLRPDIFARIMAKRPLDRSMKSFTATEISASAPDATVPVQLDGEVWGSLPMSFRVEPKALRVIR
jgi:diacylglycerol kinase (ATP)